MQEILEENSGQKHFWPEEKLFNLGYRLGPRPDRRARKAMKQAHDKPYLPFCRDMLPELETPIPDNPVREGRLKKLGDRYYTDANRWIGLETAEYGIEVV